MGTPDGASIRTPAEKNVNGGISFNAKGAEQVEVKKHCVTATFPGSDQGINLDTVNGAITLELEWIEWHKRTGVAGPFV